MNLFKPVISLLSQNKVARPRPVVVYPDLEPPEINAMHNDMSRQKWPTVLVFTGPPRVPENQVMGLLGSTGVP